MNTESLHFATSIEATMSKARMRDTAVQAKTGKNWQQWFAILDRADAMKKISHKEMAAYTYMISTGCRAGGAR